MTRPTTSLLRAALLASAAGLVATSAARADEPNPKLPKVPPPAATEPAPLTAPKPVPEPLPMGWSTYPTPGGYFMAYPSQPAFYYPSYGFGAGALPSRAVYGPSVSPLEYPYGGGWPPVAVGVRPANLPPRAAYGPSVSPLEYPYTGFVAGYPYPGYTMVYPYPRTVSSYSSGPSLTPPIGRVGGWR